jgi:hypothetical protein
MTQIAHSIIASLLGFTLLAPAQVLAQSADLARENYRQADANGDGVLIEAEFVNFIDLNAADGLGRAARISASGMHGLAFKRVDGDGDGRVTPIELQAMSRR